MSNRVTVTIVNVEQTLVSIAVDFCEEHFMDPINFMRSFIEGLFVFGKHRTYNNRSQPIIN